MRVFRLSIFPVLLVLFTLLAGCGGFHGVVTPTLTSISPATVAAGSAGFTLTATGTNFTAGTEILWDGIAQPTKVVSPTQLTTSISAAQIASAGIVAVRVMKADTTTSGVIDFTITGTGGGGGSTYSLTSISPSSIASGSPAFTLTATGVGFVNGDSITLDGVAITTSFDSATQLHATIPATNVVAAGTISVGVIDAAKNATNQLPLTVTGTSGATPPTLTSLSPSTAPSIVNPSASTAPLTLTANGTGFVSGSKVLWNGVPMTTTFVSSTQLTASIPATEFGTAQIGTSFVFVLNPDSTVSAELPFTITVSPSQNPTLVSALNAAPPSGTNHSSVGDPAFTMYLTGTLFASGAVANFGTTALATTYVSSTQLTAQVPASLLTAVSQVPITVKNTSSAASNPVPYLIGLNTLFNEVSDVVWDSRQNLLYITIPSTATKTPDTVMAVSPLHLTAPTWTYQAPAGSNPDRLALSADGKYLYVGLDHSSSVQQLILQGSQKPTAGNSISLGTYYAIDLQVSPQNSSTIAVARGSSTSIGLAQGGVAIYDGTVQRPQIVDPTTQSGDVLIDSIQWSADATKIYAANNENLRGFGDLYDLAVSTTGVTLATDYPGVFTNPNPYIHFDATTGQVYGDDGLVVNPTTGVQTGNYVAGGIMIPDPTLGLAYFVGQPATNANQVAYEVQSFNLTTFAPVATLQLFQVEGIPQHIVRWHLTNQQPIVDGLAFTTKKLTNCTFSPCSVGDGRLYVIFGPFVTQTVP